MLEVGMVGEIVNKLAVAAAVPGQLGQLKGNMVEFKVMFVDFVEVVAGMGAAFLGSRLQYLRGRQGMLMEVRCTRRLWSSCRSM
jgi:hypothetical protein